MQITKLVFWLLLCQVPALISSATVQSNILWYHSLLQPSFAPPDWLFGAVWAVLYVLIGLAGFYLTQKGLNIQNRKAVLLFVAQLVVNMLWTPLFFGAQAIRAALLILVLLIFLTGWLMQESRAVSRTAFWLLAPYLLWLCFAWTLNVSIVLLN